MTYEIPQSLQYKERIIFGLTLEQMLWLLGFGLPAFIIYAKSSLLFLPKVVVSIILVLLALPFMYLNALQHIGNYLNWLRFRHATLSDFRMKRFFDMNLIENACYYLGWKKPTKKIAILKIEPINFSIK